MSNWRISALVSHYYGLHHHETHHRISAVTINGPHPALIQPNALRAPEVILGCDWGASADIWNLGCLASLFFVPVPSI